MFNFIKKDYYNLNQIEISKKTLLSNYHYLASLDKNIRIAPVLKSNAYGHGLVVIAKILDNVSAPFFCVDSLYEAYELYKAKIKTPILVMGYIDPRNLQTKKLPFSYAVFDKEMLLAIHTCQPHAGIHLFIDTGMHREGIPLQDLPDFLTIAKKFSLNIEGMMSHLAMANKPNDKYTNMQINKFQEALQILKDYKIETKWQHIAASEGLLLHEKYKDELCTMSRTGIALYGINDNHPQLKPVLQLTTKIVQIKQLRKGEKVGYDFTFTAKKAMRIAILPLGFHDGIEKKLSNNGFVLLQNVACPIIGKVSMNITTIDITNVPEAKVGDTVSVYTNDVKQPNTIDNTSRLSGLTPYELLVHLDPSIKRLVQA